MTTSDHKKPGKNQAAHKDPSKKGDLVHKTESEQPWRPPMKQQEHKK